MHVDGTETHVRLCENNSAHTETNNCEFSSKITKKASCTEVGIETFTCSVCGYSYDEEIVPIGHKDIDNNGVCDECGENICKHEEARHFDVVKATCCSQGNTEYYYCEKCGLCASDSKFANIIVKADTVTEINSENHAGETEIRNEAAATCTKDGYTGDTYCLGCNKKIATGEKINSLGHSFTEYVSDNNATCTEDGTKTAKCDRCDATDTVIEENSITSHTVVVDEAIEATCKNSGLTEGMHCSVCGKVIVEQKKTAKLQHDFEKLEVIEATCKDNGYTLYECKKCGAQEHRDVIKATGHVDVDDDGVCDVCGSDTSFLNRSFEVFLDLIGMLLILVFKFLVMLATA